MDSNQSAFKKVVRFLATRPTSQLSLVSIALGAVFGVVAKQFMPSESITRVFSYLGLIFINSLKVVVLIFVITIMLRTPMDMLEVGEAKKLGFLAIGYYVLTSLLSSLIGLAFVNIIRPGTHKFNMCEINESPGTFSNLEKVSLMDTILDIGTMAIPKNIFEAIVENNILGILTVFLVLGFFLSKYANTHNGQRFRSILDLIYQANIDLLGFIITLTPVGVFSLIAGEISKINDNCIFLRMAIYMATFLLANLFHVLVSLNLIYYAFTRKNPFVYAWNFVPAFITAFSTASSAAALPLNFQGAMKMNLDKNTANFVLPLGSTLNMNGSSIYYPVTIVFISLLYGKPMSIATQILCCFVATVVTVGGAPIPSGALVYLELVASTVGVSLPATALTLIWAIDPLMDRILTTTNVIGDAYAVEVIDVIYKYLIRKNKIEEAKENPLAETEKTMKRAKSLSNSSLSLAKSAERGYFKGSNSKTSGYKPGIP